MAPVRSTVARLLFHGDTAWLVADLHARNFVRAGDGALRVIDLVAAPWPRAAAMRHPLISEWLERVRENPQAGLLRPVADAEL